MYRIDDKPEAIKRIQKYLSVVLTPKVFIVPSGVYDTDTRLSVIDYQNSKSIYPTGIVDYQTFELLYSDYKYKTTANRLTETLKSFISFPLMPGIMSEEMMHINRMLNDLLNYYGYTHRLRDSSFYSDETSLAISIMQDIYSLRQKNYIDEELYLRMVVDHNSIGKFNNIFRITE